jgi:hypothetical protein
MYRKLYIPLVFFLLLNSVSIFSQKQDFRTWWAVEAEGELFNLVDFSISPELRFWDNSSSFESLHAELDLSVPLTKYFRLGGMYRYQYERIRVNRDKFANRMGIYAEFDTRIDHIRIAYRAMYQHEYTNFSSTELGNIPESQHRHKLSFQYRDKDWDITPVLAAELFYTINPGWISYQHKLRITAGVKYRLTKDINVGIAYKFQQEYYENNPLTSNIIKTSIEFEL